MKDNQISMINEELRNLSGASEFTLKSVSLTTDDGRDTGVVEVVAAWRVPLDEILPEERTVMRITVTRPGATD